MCIQGDNFKIGRTEIHILKLSIVNLSSFWGTVCICRPALKKDTDQNVLPVIFQYSCKIRQPAIFEPDGLGKSYVPQKKALNSKKWA